MKVVTPLKSIIALFLCFVFLFLSACTPAAPISTSSQSEAVGSEASDSTETDNTPTQSKETVPSRSEVSHSQPVTQTSSVKNTASKKTSSKATSSQKVTTPSKPSVTKPPIQLEQEVVPQPEKLPEAKPVEKPEEIKPVIATLTPIQPNAFHGRATLAKRANAATLLAAYDRIVAGVESRADTINLKDSDHPLKDTELEEVLSYYVADYPQHFWLGKEFLYSMNAATYVVYDFRPKYVIDASDLAQAKTNWNNAVKEILKDITSSVSEYDREKLIHDRLAAKVVYDLTAPHAYTAYGALVEGRAVCEGYARAFQYLCYQAGLQCLLVSGTSVNASTGKPEGHAWNVVQIDGKYYHLDLTWDDQESKIFYAYFNLTDDMIKDDHTIGAENYPLPTCDTKTANYFVKNGGFLGNTYTVGTVGQQLKTGGGTGRFYVDDPAQFWVWFQKNESAIVTILDIKGGYGYGRTYLGHETIITITKG